ncbi:hypothetical protein WSM22_02720 [Cytophagales bacterium WSM2-2]|nr:hypothetical protein WSM22_02720 [Cytophagales bacterium WSM2-2]
MRKLGLILLLLSSGFTFAPGKLVKTKVAEGITVSLPKSLAPMTEDDIIVRYPSVRAPLGAFTNMERSVDFSVNISATQWVQDDIEIAAKFFKSGIFNLYDRVDIINSGIQTINKKKYIFYEFESRINGNKLKEGERQAIFRYSYVQYYVEKGRTLVFAFNCPKDQRPQWQSSAHAIMKSIKLK